MMDKIPDVILVGVAVGVFVGGTVWALAWWLSGKFAEVLSLVYQQMSRLLDKLEYHEKHDDQRFGQLREDLGEIRIRNASKDTIVAALLEKMNKLE